MDPLMIPGGIGKLIDAFLRDFQPVAHYDFLAYLAGKLLETAEYHPRHPDPLLRRATPAMYRNRCAHALRAVIRAGTMGEQRLIMETTDADRHGGLGTRGIGFVDAGVSGGVWGLENGYALMLGGPKDAVAKVEPFARILAPAADRGWIHCGPAGAGHYVKMIHNGIEYGMMQAYAEGLSMMNAKTEFDLDLAAITEMWRHGSVVRSWLLDLTADFLKAGQSLDSISPVVADSGEGRWTAIEAIELGVPAPVMSLALMARFASQGQDDYAARLLAMMRAGFGGHAVQATKPK